MPATNRIFLKNHTIATASENINFLKIDLTENMQDNYTENHTTL